MVKKNNNNDGINQENEDKLEKQKEKLNEEIKALEEALEKQEARLSGLQSNAFQLANYYFVFQGVILTTLCNRNTILKCSDRWFLATLSALAATVNLFALVSIGTKYNRIFSQQAKTWSKCNELQIEQEKQRLPNTINKYPSSPAQPVHVDKYGIIQRWVYFSICIIFFLLFAIIVFVGCLRFLCIHREVPKKKETEMQRLH
ncbi:uncharacterized protein LOC123914913 isoform X2 [Trifolium pratense]|uniref:uncharacterized protein LOC123914913 isoform X2 n=1 Tax=Trifolium pratense TaxID=57577 RepID=UPI001E69056D|nr:uncharacterized protein LOC123914913 isoform X2 [Trifolium pratense]